MRSAKVRPSEHLQTAGRLSVPAGLEQVLPWPRPGRDFKPPTENINEEEQLVSKSNLGQRILLGRNKISGQYECLSCNFNSILQTEWNVTFWTGRLVDVSHRHRSIRTVTTDL